MKKIVLLCATALLMTGCADKEAYQQAVLAQMETEQDLKDYNIDPAYMTECIMDLSAKNMPGSFPYDPARMEAYRHYALMVSMSTVEDKQKRFEELRTLFGSPRDLAEAHANYTESVMECVSSIVAKSEPKKADKE